MPNQPKTPQRSIRIDNKLWTAATAKAVAQGTTVSDVIRRYLEQWTAS